jgi:parallel beta-helix repeat protein
MALPQGLFLPPRTTTLYVAAANASDRARAQADFLCTGVNDHLIIQAALDALPAAGGMVFLSEGTFHCEAQINLDSNQTLKGCGRNTILTTATADLVFLSAVGGAGTELTGIVIADMQIDGGAGAVSDCGIYFEYVDYSFIFNVYSRRHASGTGTYLVGIILVNSDFNTVTGNTCQGNGYDGIALVMSSTNTVTGNTCQGNGGSGIVLGMSSTNTVTGNTLTENSQSATNTYDDIYLESSDYNNIQANTCRAGALANKPRYGINISNATCDKNVIIGNDLYDDGFGTGSFNDAGTLTHVEDNNRGIQLDQIRHYRRVQNTSGAQRVAGDVVSLKAVANGYEVTAPAAVGERQVFGMVAETINNNDWGLVQVKGKTTALKATNAGGGNIVIGDNLITENGVRARKAAAATDPIFARALEACAAANCTIDAYIKSPWD